MINAEFGLHELTVEAALHERQRPKLDRGPRHLFLSACTVGLGAAPGELVAREIAVFITDHTLITVRKTPGPGHADRRPLASLAVRMSAAGAGGVCGR